MVLFSKRRVNKMTKINSVLGPLDTAKLGVTLCHEHLQDSSTALIMNYPELMEKAYKKHIIDGLKKAKAGGIDTVVDASTMDLGRDVNLLAEASRASGVNVITISGWALEKPRFFPGITVKRCAQAFIKDIKVGIAGTDIKAGVLKGASDRAGVLPGEAIVLRALAWAHLETGVPIMLHSSCAGEIARQQIAILKEEGVNMGRVKIDHTNDTTDLKYLTWILDQGCFLGLDRYPGSRITPKERTNCLKALLDMGYQDRLCVSHDWSLARFRSRKSPAGSPEKRKKINPYGFLFIRDVVFPQLREMGVSEKVISTLLVNGPRKFFEGK
jgi:phosphotriesterase-related protein